MSKKLTLKVTKTAFYKGALVNPGEIIKNYSGDIPTWATLANGDEMPKEDNKNVPPVDDSKVKKDGEGELVTVDETNNESAVQDEKEIVVAGDGGVHEISADDAAKEGETPVEQTEAELMEEYNKLLDEAVDKNIPLEDVDKKTVKEQIAELKVLLGKE